MLITCMEIRDEYTCMFNFNSCSIINFNLIIFRKEISEENFKYNVEEKIGGNKRI